MSKEEAKRFAFTAFKNDESGFSFASSLLALFIISLSLPLLVFAMAKIRVLPSEESMMMHQLFFMLQNEVNQAVEVYHDDKRLYFRLTTGETAFIEQYQDVLRRRVEQKGHEIYARNIESISLTSVPYGIIVTIKTKRGGLYERTLVVMDE